MVAYGEPRGTYSEAHGKWKGRNANAREAYMRNARGNIWCNKQAKTLGNLKRK